jgi:hypothetical protein
MVLSILFALVDRVWNSLKASLQIRATTPTEQMEGSGERRGYNEG